MIAPTFEALPFATNSHVHLPPNFSAFDSRSEPFAMAAREGIGLIGLSNYYDYSIYREVTERGAEQGVYILTGTEIIAIDPVLRDAGIKVNDPGNPGKVYLCGKGMRRALDLPSHGRELLQRIRSADEKRISEMAAKLTGHLSQNGCPTDLTANSIRSMVARMADVPEQVVVLQERHLAMAYQREMVRNNLDATKVAALLGPAAPANVSDEVALQNAIRSALMKSGKVAFVAEEFVTIAEARSLVLAAGGIPCYPVLADGTKPIAEYETDPVELARNLKKLGYYAAEFIPIRNQPDVLERYVLAMRGEGLIILAGTEHNTTEKIPLTPTCVGGAPIPAEVRRIFDEGICVAVAHQDSEATSYVNESGELPVPWEQQEQHVARLAKIGRGILCRLHESRAKGGNA